MGWAWGNRLARCLAANHPDLVATVTLLAAGGKVPPDAEVYAAFLRLREPNLWQAERREATRIALPAPTSDPSLLLDVDDAWPDGGPAAFAASRATPLDDWWSGRSVPRLVVQGEYDRIAPAGNGRALRNEYPDRVDLVEIADAGHAMVLEQPTAEAKAVVLVSSDPSVSWVTNLRKRTATGNSSTVLWSPRPHESVSVARPVIGARTVARERTRIRKVGPGRQGRPVEVQV